jgi:hypothetical protein
VSTPWQRDSARERLRGLNESFADAQRAAGWNDQLFSIYAIPFLVALPVVGAALGLASFAGIAGGFLVATGERSPDFSPAGLLFVAVLAGLFANSFLRALARGADAIFGTNTPQQRRGPQ